MSRTKLSLLAGIILFHFSIMVIGTLDPDVDGSKPFWWALGWYGKLTGASASYSFFSPDIPREVTFHFTIYNHDQTKFETTLQDTANNEVNARVGNILRTIPRNFNNKKIVRSLAASVTAAMFKVFPEADKIRIRGQIFILPSMAEYLIGERPKTKQIYTAVFTKGQGL